MVAADEGHGFAGQLNKLATFAAPEKFFARHLSTRYQEAMKPDVAQRLKELTVDPNTVVLKKSEAAAGGEGRSGKH